MSHRDLARGMAHGFSSSRSISIGALALALLRVLHTSPDGAMLCELLGEALQCLAAGRHLREVSPQHLHLPRGLTTQHLPRAPLPNPINPPLYEQSLLALRIDYPPTPAFTQTTMLYSTRAIVPANGFLPYGGRRVRAPPSSEASTRSPGPSSTQTQARRHISIVEQLALMVIPTSRLQAIPSFWIRTSPS
ncbi:hypothetical protein C8F01DRAFT_640228 [Mycena amicta]|nr:hypothetical protein C8F01DRAFT_640228 [Mycena amicta]